MENKIEIRMLEILNQPEFRKSVAKISPLTQRIENCADLNDLKISCFNAESGMIRINYEAIASGSIYPHTRTNLSRNGIIKKHQVYASIRKGESGNKYNHEELILGDLGSKLQIWLKIYEPNYKK